MNKRMLVGIVVLVLIVVAGVFLYNKTNKEQGYSVVYVNTGEVYAGKLKVFNDLVLTDGYILQATKNEADPTKNNFQLQPIKDALWAPKEVHFIKDNVVFYGPLLPTSKIAETIAAQKVK